MIRLAGVAAGVAGGVYEVLRRRKPGGRPVWERTNHAGRVVDLCAGPAAAAGVLAGFSSLPPRVRGAGALAVVASAVCGAYDDHAGAGDPRRGVRAHLAALREGEVTSGGVKLLGIGAAGLVAGAVLRERAVDKVLAGVVIAGSAHLVNLLDVRPGRAAGAVVALGLPGVARGVGAAAAPVGAAAALLKDDLAARTTLGDTGAHALGAGLGTAVVAGNGRTGLALHAAALVAVALVMEVKSPQSG